MKLGLAPTPIGYYSEVVGLPKDITDGKNVIAAAIITASHNPPEYNGYKVYWEDGAQITPPHDTGIMAEVEAVTDYATVKTMSLEAAKEAGLYEVIGEAVDDAYMEELKKQVIHQDAIDQMNKDLKIVYSPLHGTGNIPVRRILKELGFENVLSLIHI